MQVFIVILIFTILAVVLGGSGVWFTRSGFIGLRLTYRSKSWPSAPGNILSATVIMDVEKSGRRRNTFFRPWVQSSYTVNGKTYGCSRLSFNDDVVAYQSKEKAHAALQPYAVGQVIPVYYDPVNPAVSVMELGKTGPSWRSFTSGILCLLLAFMVIVMAINIVSGMLG